MWLVECRGEGAGGRLVAIRWQRGLSLFLGLVTRSRFQRVTAGVTGGCGEGGGGEMGWCCPG